jgi:hypothetical protein
MQGGRHALRDRLPLFLSQTKTIIPTKTSLYYRILRKAEAVVTSFAMKTGHLEMLSNKIAIFS